MRTELDCLDCFRKQALATSRLAGADEKTQARVLTEVGRLLPLLDLTTSPPENAVAVYGKIAEITGVRDPFAEVKAAGTRLSLDLRDEVRQRISVAADPLYAAVRYAIAANIIDYGTQRPFDALRALQSCLDQPLVLDGYDRFRAAVTGSAGVKVLYLADNCGEIVFDGLLVEQLQKLGCEVTLAVRGEAILNDATLEDAGASGLADLCPVISNGTNCPGTPLAGCSEEFRRAFARAEVIVSKGQGNYETLSAVAAAIYFLLTVKCPVVARKISGEHGLAPGRLTGRGEMILMQGKV
ncbi:MAG: damage-control phosphatase ARMT1 family protein [Desulfobulbaceae bacterium]